jgi:hypothetical protein
MRGVPLAAGGAGGGAAGRVRDRLLNIIRTQMKLGAAQQREKKLSA